MGEADRNAAYRAATAHLPPLTDAGVWIWSDADIDILRKAFASRFGDTSRTEPLMMVAAAGIRIALARMKASDPEPSLIEHLIHQGRADTGEGR
jgi:hypothetical protein